MVLAAWLALAFAAVLQAEGCISGAPCYSEAGIVNAANNLPELAPNTLATIYGADLAFVTRAVTAYDISGESMPVKLGGVVIQAGSETAPLYYVSPTQVNFVVPAYLRGSVPLQLIREGRSGPVVTLRLLDAAPALFRAGGSVAGTHAGGTPLDAVAPTRPGETIVLYATGLGDLDLPARRPSNQIPGGPALLARFSEFRVAVGARVLDPGSVLYAGAAPGFLGLYQINVTLPEDLAASPDEVRVGFPDRMSEGVELPVASKGTATDSRLWNRLAVPGHAWGLEGVKRSGDTPGSLRRVLHLLEIDGCTLGFSHSFLPPIPEVSVEEPCDGREQFVALHRLGDEALHAIEPAKGAVFVGGVGRQRQHRHGAIPVH